MTKSKRNATLMITLVLAAVLAGLLYAALKPPALPMGAHMPALAFASPAGTDTLRPSPAKTTLIMLFSKRCPHCLYELDLFEKHIDQFACARIYLATTDRDFIPGVDHLRWPALSRAENFHWVCLDEKQYARHFGAAISPSFFIFDNEGTLREKIRGEIKLEALLAKIKQDGERSRVEARLQGGAAQGAGWERDFRGAQGAVSQLGARLQGGAAQEAGRERDKESRSGLDEDRPAARPTLENVQVVPESLLDAPVR